MKVQFCCVVLLCALQSAVCRDLSWWPYTTFLQPTVNPWPTLPPCKNPAATRSTDDNLCHLYINFDDFAQPDCNQPDGSAMPPEYQGLTWSGYGTVRLGFANAPTPPVVVEIEAGAFLQISSPTPIRVDSLYLAAACGATAENLVFDVFAGSAFHDATAACHTFNKYSAGDWNFANSYNVFTVELAANSAAYLDSIDIVVLD